MPAFAGRTPFRKVDQLTQTLRFSGRSACVDSGPSEFFGVLDYAAHTRSGCKHTVPRVGNRTECPPDLTPPFCRLWPPGVRFESLTRERACPLPLVQSCLAPLARLLLWRNRREKHPRRSPKGRGRPRSRRLGQLRTSRGSGSRSINAPRCRRRIATPRVAVCRHVQPLAGPCRATWCNPASVLTVLPGSLGIGGSIPPSSTTIPEARRTLVASGFVSADAALTEERPVSASR